MKPVIIGGGLAGLTVALALAPMPVIVISPKKLGDESSSGWAQGGIAAAIDNADSAKAHAEDTKKAGAGLCDPLIVKQVTEDGLSIIQQLIDRGVTFDRDDKGTFHLGLEAAHSHRRIVHAQGASTGAAIMKALTVAVRNAPSIELIEDATASALLTDDAITGVVIEKNGTSQTIATNRVVLATGGAGALWQHTTNPLGCWGQGLALAAHAGATLADLEFMQFHPTAIDIGRDPMPLASEALRGEGAILIDENGQRFTDELAARDIVARAIWAHRQKSHQVYLDTRAALGDTFPTRFPGIYAACAAAHIDPTKEPIPVRPAAHYHMGGVVTDNRGRTSVDGLWACGEVACTGLHGANRLASNSLLEAASFGSRVAEDIKNTGTSLTPVKSQPASPPLMNPMSVAPQVRAIMSANVGMLRDRKGLERAVNQLTPLAVKSDMALVGLMMSIAALKREESRGAHTRTDFPATSAKQAHRNKFTLEDILPSIEPKLAVGA